MNFLVLLVVLGVCTALPQGFLRDTPEVAAEKHRFFTLYNKLARASAAAPDIHIYSQQTKTAPAQHVPVFAIAQPQLNVWRGPHASRIPAGLPGSGNVANTAEVNNAIIEFSQAYQAALAATRPRTATGPINFSLPASFNVRPAPPLQAARWTGPVAATIPAGLPGSGRVTETADVQLARAAFDAAFAQQLARVAPKPTRF